MRALLRRATQVYHEEGFVPTIEKSMRFVPRYLRHVLGVKGLYGIDHYQRLLLWWNARPYADSVDPFTVIDVDPTVIAHVTKRGPNPGRFQWQDIGRVQGGSWDRSDDCVEDLPVVTALRRRFEDGDEWEDIEFIQHVLDQVERGNVVWRGCNTESDVWEACERVDELYESIRDRGYLRQRDFIEQNEISPDKYVSDDGFNRYDEVVVDIGRDGQFLFVDGRHRLAIARILGLDRIPVRISARHTQWQRIREAIGNMPQLELPAEVRQYLDHPDIKQLTEQGTETD